MATNLEDMYIVFLRNDETSGSPETSRSRPPDDRMRLQAAWYTRSGGVPRSTSR